MKKISLQACLWALAAPLLFFSQGASAVMITQSFALGEYVALTGNGAVDSGQSIGTLAGAGSDGLGSRLLSFGGLIASAGGGTLTIKSRGFGETGVLGCGGLGFHSVAAPNVNTYQDCDTVDPFTNVGIDIAAVDDDPTGTVGQPEFFGVTLNTADFGEYNCFGDDGKTDINSVSGSSCAGNVRGEPGVGTGGVNYEFSLELAGIDSLIDTGTVDVALFFSEAVAHHNEGDIIDVTLEYTAVPIPAALPLFASGLIGLGLVARRKKKKAA